jgi:hypothetical protein
MREELLEDVTAMNRRPIPGNQEAARHLPQRDSYFSHHRFNSGT